MHLCVINWGNVHAHVFCESVFNLEEVRGPGRGTCI